MSASYIVSLVYHRMEDDFYGELDYEILKQNYIDLRGVLPYGDITEDIGLYYQDWINNTIDIPHIHGKLYHLVVSVTTTYHKDYWGEIECDIDYEVLSHKVDELSIDEYLRYLNVTDVREG
ncbi:hypothetical protein S140_72 [Shewanella sp. phage 1/40]|uniref:hypothetical protein n=1 Tax=Shewanella sp. phage 1/40 TaxID=1458860 RepID=UPI0004F6B953|nr:hypothetical protein S140_72 [Shewanella sp. phage 1/40]AHK11482.1 hypothetical protein S140_72 [Shewanella sp. phage 1/40]